ncbi:unnamed protein product [Rotaria magnacalcarata]|uniref:Methyltransferase domain-containing protein n=1 Tax=Rotaria magnacalcarata TaxID=392030 RepID=A0A819D9J7_9BILA|nr:unnamed protein product [Rotaria magnacalcarata]CAF2107942.1 unnamed protein product [Rotaria magnacalcarata]CAF3831799.1 unnamed protein product [Rotaria magnacalcarata]CAF4207913.1 unnamed protein product [Rotaria magnacalcarata]
MASERNKDEAPPQELFFRISGTGEGHWETERPQPVIVKLVQQGFFYGKLLDIGCGIGDNTIYIAKHTSNVSITATDLVPKAIEVAREKAQKANVNILFEVVDMIADLSTTNLKQNSYDVILDAAVFHVFSNKDRLVYIKNLESLIKPNGLYIQLCFSEKETRQGGPPRVKKSDLYQLFSSKNGWTIESIEDAIYESTSAGPLGLDGRAYLSLIRRDKSV